MSNHHHFNDSLSRRSLLGAATAGAVAAAVGTSTQAAAVPVDDARSRQKLRLRYDQTTYAFADLVLPAAPGAVWQRRTNPAAPWRQVDVGTARHARITPTWRDIDAEYRAIAPEGRVVRQVQLLCPSLQGVDPADYGAVGDGVTDDTAALNSALTAAAALDTGVDLLGRNYLISGRVRIVNGVTAVFGGSLEQAPGTNTSALFFEGMTEGRPANVSGCVICDVEVLMTEGSGSVGFGGSSPSNVAIIHCTAGNAAGYGRPIQIMNRVEGGEDTSNIVIRGNTVTLAPEHGTAIGVRAPWDQLGLPDMPTYWKTYFQGPDKTYTCSDVEISDNHISGGYYGIEVYAIDDFVLEGNDATLNMRNVSVQNTCLRGTIRDNTFSDSISSSIHLAYGSSDCLITDNTINTSRSYGEGLLQAYVGCRNNQFLNNQVTSTSPTGPKWYIYCGVHSDDNRFEGNTLTGPCLSAYIAVEAAWDSTNTHLAHRASEFPGLFADWASADTDNVQLVDNEINQSSPVELICLADITEPAGTFRVTNPVLSGNHTTGSTAPIVPHTYTG